MENWTPALTPGEHIACGRRAEVEEIRSTNRQTRDPRNQQSGRDVLDASPLQQSAKTCHIPIIKGPRSRRQFRIINRSPFSSTRAQYLPTRPPGYMISIPMLVITDLSVRRPRVYSSTVTGARSPDHIHAGCHDAYRVDYIEYGSHSLSLGGQNVAP